MELPMFAWNEYEYAIKAIGKSKKWKPEIFVSQYSNKTTFLHELGLLSKDAETGVGEGRVHLTEVGKKYYLLKFCTNQEDEARELLKNTLKAYKPVKLLMQVFWGKPNISKTNVSNLLCHYGVIDEEVNIGSFLSLLNKLGILSYSKKHDRVTILEQHQENILGPQDYFVSKEKPYSNLRKVQRMISESRKYIHWFEKHFSPKMYELISQNTDGNGISSIKLLTGVEHITEVRRDEFKKLKKELGNKGISLSHRVLTDKGVLNTIHGRWFISSNHIYNIPPLDTILQGQTDELIVRTKEPGFEAWWKKSIDIISGWSSIEKTIGTGDLYDGRKK